jgi:hypothetical protein
MTDETELSDEDQWQNRWMNAVYDLAAALKESHQTNPWPESPLLPQAMNYLMTELWDRCFSQTEIRVAFEDAVSDMPRYAAGDEIRP